MNDIDDWLNSLGINDSTHGEVTTLVNTSNEILEQAMETSESSNSPITPEDFNDILADNGFQEPEYEEAEGVEEEEEGEVNTEYNEDSDAERDLDAEEDADWDDAIASGALQVVQRVNEENYPEHNPDEETVQVSIGDQSAEVPVVHEQVSENALEAFNAIAETEASPTQEPLILPNSPTLLLNNATSRF